MHFAHVDMLRMRHDQRDVASTSAANFQQLHICRPFKQQGDLLPSLHGMQVPCTGSICLAQTGSGHGLANRLKDFSHEVCLGPCQSKCS